MRTALRPWPALVSLAQRSAKPERRLLAEIALFGIAYGLTAKVGLNYSVIASNVTLIWPPSGISLFVVLRFGYRLWPGILIGDLIANAGTGAPIVSVFGIAAGNIVETLICAWVLRRFLQFHAELDRVRDVLALLVLGSACAALSALVGPASLMIGGAIAPALYWKVWLEWLMGDATGVIVLTPLLLAWTQWRRFVPDTKQTLEAALLLAILLPVCVTLFGGLGLVSHGYYPASLAIFPIAVWAALRFGLHGATAVTSIVSIAAVWGTVHGRGPFVVEEGVESLVRWWAFVNVITITSLLLAASRAERSRAQVQLQRERDFVSTILDAEGALVVVLDHQGCVLRVNRAFEKVTGFAACEALAMSFTRTFVSPGHWEKIDSSTELLRRNVSSVVRFEAELLRKNGVPLLVSWSSAVLRDAGGRVEHLITTGIDITEQTKATAALRQARRSLEARVAERTRELAAINESLKQEIAQRRQLEREIIQVAEHEQMRIGQELHDGLGQHLTAAAFMSELLAGKLSERDLPEAADASYIESMLSDAVSHTRLLARGLFPVELADNGLMSALEQLALNTKRLQVDCRFHCHTPVLVVDNAVAVNLHRIAQEAVNNAIKHSKASRITVELDRRAGMISLNVVDNGVGLPRESERGAGMGLRIMHHRADLIGAELAFINQPDGGLCVRLSMSDLKESFHVREPAPI